jgi:hypothetical protein
MKKTITKMGIYCSLLLTLAGSAKAQMADTSAEFKPSGKLWGYGFGDYAYKGGTDEINRGGNNQYTKVPVNANEFQWRRLYLGYNYNISKKFSAEFLLAAEDDWAGGVLGQSAASVTVNTVTGTGTPNLGGNGDVLLNTKFAPYIKLANIRWKNIFKNSDLVIGQAPTPTFAQGSALKENARNSQTSEEVWGYRSIERTIVDIRRTSSYDFGASLQGWFDNNGNYGYDVMVANGTGAKPEGDQNKWFYGDVYAKFLNKKLIIDLYQDYEKINWGVYVKGPNGNWNHDRNMTKLFVAYTTPKFTVGFEGYINTLMGDVIVTGIDKNTYYRTTDAMGISVFTKGRITKEKLGWFAMFDNVDNSGNLNNIVGQANTKSYTVGTSQYDPTTKEMFGTFGLDYTPIKNVHIMPNVWLNTYTSALDVNGANSTGTKYSTMNSNVTGIKGTDAVYRLTFYYVYGK